MLAQSADYDENALTLTIKLRDGVKFHSGATLTADDVVASLNRYRQSAGTGAVLKSLTVASITASAPDTVVFKLTGPDRRRCPGLLTLTPASIFSKAVGRWQSRARRRTDDVSIAPALIRLRAIPARPSGGDRALCTDYKPRSEPTSGSAGAKTAPADRIIFLPQAEPSVRRDSLLTGAVDVATTLPFDFLSSRHQGQPRHAVPDSDPTTTNR